jgi:hypothetical protein
MGVMKRIREVKLYRLWWRKLSERVVSEDRSEVGRGECLPGQGVFSFMEAGEVRRRASGRGRKGSVRNWCSPCARSSPPKS